VKKELATICKFGFGFVWMAIIFWGCTTDPGKTGLGLLPTGDLVSVGKVIEKETIKAFTVTDGNQRTDKPEYNLLGTFNDPVFGKTTTDFALQFRLDSFPAKQNVVAVDSLVLYLLYNQIYGDVTTTQKLKVYELGSSVSVDTKYYQDVNLKGMAKSEVLADFSYIPKFKLDSLTADYGSTKKVPKDTVVQTIRIKLNKSLATKLLAADSLTLSGNDAFTQYFKGLYVEAGDLNQGGTIMKVKTIASGSRLVMFYRTAKDTLKINYKINNNSARISRFTHDYSKTIFAANLDKLDKQDSLLYLQTTGGLRNKILIPDLENWTKLIPNNSGNSANIAINKAELIFHVDTIASDTAKYVPPGQLVLSALDKDGLEYLPSDVSFSSTYYGGVYNHKDKTYRFNIAKHMQEVIDKKKDNYGFYLATAFRSAIFRRVVLKGATSKTGIRLEITYSKIK